MADLGGRPRSRGQILLVTALILGVSFVALALILNSAIFTENLASRGDTTGADEVVTYQNNLQDGIDNVVAFETRNATTSDTHTVVLGRIETGVSDADNITVRRHAKRGATSNVSIDDYTEGSRIYQTNSSRNFTNATGAHDWTVADDVDNTRSFRLNVSRAPLPTCNLFSDCYTLHVSDGSDTWMVSVSDSASGVEVQVDNGTTTAACDPVDQSFVPIDVTGGTVAGQECSALTFTDGPDAGYDIEFVNSDRIEGTYSLAVDNESLSTASLSRFSDTDNPRVAPAVYNLTVEYHYRTSDIVVGKEFGVAPGDPDGR